MSAWSFAHTERPLRLLMGDDAVAALPAELERLEASRALVISTPGQSSLAAQLSDALGAASAGVFARALPQVPRENVDEAAAVLAAERADAVVTVGGGSAIGLGKALALEARDRLPLLCFPTTYAGSECTRIWGITEGGVKTTGRNVRVAPALIAYVPGWNASLPASVSAASGMNAIAHAVEALYAHDATPASDLVAVESIRALRTSLPGVVADPHDLQARSSALWGAYLAGRALDATSMGLHHKLCHVLGGSFGLPHASTHAVLLPYAAAYNAPAAPRAMEAIAGALDVASAPIGLWRLGRAIGTPPSLEALGFRAADMARAVDLALQREYPNPRALEASALTEMLEAAVSGAEPTPG